MLVDVPTILPFNKEELEIQGKMEEAGFVKRHLSAYRLHRTGFYDNISPYEFQCIIVNEYPFDVAFDPEWRDASTHDRLEEMIRRSRMDLPNAFGVCDYPDQLIEKFPVIETSEKKFIVTFGKLEKENEVPNNWRWHKWGPYIGEQDPQCEYLYDEPVIETVYLYHIYEVNF